MGGLKDTSLEAKAAIVGAMYALERLFAASGAAGTNLTNFNALTDISTQRLQEWQYAARQAGVSGESLAGSVKGIQSTMGAIARGEGGPAGAKFIGSMVGGFNPNQLQNTEYVLKKLQDFATNPAVTAVQKRWALASFGVGEDVSAALIRGMFNPEVMKRAPRYSEKEIADLNKANIAWSNLGQTIEMAIGHFNAKHGGQLVGDISKLVVQVERLAGAFVDLAENLKLFAAAGSTLGAIADAIGTTATIFGGSDTAYQNLIHKKFEAMKNQDDRPLYKKWGWDKIWGDNEGYLKDIGGPVEVNVHQNLNFQHDGKDHKKTGDSVKKAASHAYRQIPSQLEWA